ncbi:raucaffricine-o-beta-d-glucosidase, partial [Quercus suber]
GDVRIMKKMGLDAYRFSISWSRVLPKGKLSGGLFAMTECRYTPLCDPLPLGSSQALEDEYGGFLSPHIV